MQNKTGIFLWRIVKFPNKNNILFAFSCWIDMHGYLSMNHEIYLSRQWGQVKLYAL